MSKSLSFMEVVTATARQKTGAARARRNSGSTIEKPRDVILGACEAISAQLKADGFAFLKSGPKLKRAEGGLIFTIYFQSDRNNMAGRRAAIWIHGGVHSVALANWRRVHPLPWREGGGPDAGLVTGGQIGNLTLEPSWLEWDFADKSRRDDEIDDAISSIRQILLPFFALFHDPEHAIETLVHYRLLWQSSLLEYALAVLGRDAAEETGRAFLRLNPRISEHYRLAVAEYRRNGLPRYRSNEGSDLAALAVAADLDFSIE